MNVIHDREVIRGAFHLRRESAALLPGPRFGCYADAALLSRVQHPPDEQKASRLAITDEVMNGRSTVKVMGSSGRAEVNSMMTAVAAAASVPCSSTETKALCSTLPMYRSWLPSRPEKSARSGSKASVVPGF